MRVTGQPRSPSRHTRRKPHPTASNATNAQHTHQQSESAPPHDEPTPPHPARTTHSRVPPVFKSINAPSNRVPCVRIPDSSGCRIASGLTLGEESQCSPGVNRRAVDPHLKRHRHRIRRHQDARPNPNRLHCVFTDSGAMPKRFSAVFHKRLAMTSSLRSPKSSSSV